MEAHTTDTRFWSLSCNLNSSPSKKAEKSIHILILCAAYWKTWTKSLKLMQHKVILGGVTLLPVKMFFFLDRHCFGLSRPLKKVCWATSRKKLIHIAACDGLIKKCVERKAERPFMLSVCHLLKSLIKLMRSTAIWGWSRGKSVFFLERHFLVSREQLQRFVEQKGEKSLFI